MTEAEGIGCYCLWLTEASLSLYFPAAGTDFLTDGVTGSYYGGRSEHRVRKAAAYYPEWRHSHTASAQQSVPEKMAGSDAVLSAGTPAGDGVEFLGSDPGFCGSRVRLHQG